MTEVEANVAELKEEDDKDEDESLYSDPNGELVEIFALLLF